MTQLMNAPSRKKVLGPVLAANWWLFLLWPTVVGGYAIVSSFERPGPSLTAFGDIVQCVVPGFAIIGLLLNIKSKNRRENAFWLLMALGCTIWMLAQFLWTYVEVVQRQAIPTPFIGDIIYFIHAVPMIAALALAPHIETKEQNSRFGYMDFSLLLLWWFYLYMFVVSPWQYVAPNYAAYGRNYTRIADFEYLVLAVGLGVLLLHAKGAWRRVFAHLFGAASLYFVGAHIIDVAIDRNVYFTGSVYDLPLVSSFIWMGTAGVLAHRSPSRGQQAAASGENAWPERGAIAAVVSMPVLALWALQSSSMPDEVRHFRLVITCVTVIGAVFLIFLRQRLMARHLLNLVQSLQSSVEDLRRLQHKMVQREKLVSLGQLAAGAAHEINNPLTGILGYAELLSDQSNTDQRQRILAEKIFQLARRIKELVSNLISFSRPHPVEQKDLDVNDVLKAALDLCELNLAGSNIRVETELADLLPQVQGNSSHLGQVFLNIMQNAIDAMEERGGGVLTIRSASNGTMVTADFADTGPGVQQPDRVFDPFYTTKPVGKGTGLGLSICHGIVEQHGGHISCENLATGGALFRITLPAVLVPVLNPAIQTADCAQH